jgi:hypothetical protein
MTSYRLYYCNSEGTKFGADDFHAANDAGAIERARVLVKLRSPVFEVWQGERLVHRERCAANG